MSPEEKLKGMIQAAELPVRGSYRRGEVCAILGIGDASFWRLLNRCERDDQGQMVHPDCLDSFELRSQRRVTYTELVAFLTRNNSYTRQHAVDPRQMALFEGV
uniref:Putative cytoplasmic protein n=1 Tax=Geobacter sp. (strain M21) TaxID=443144 RepID=C6E6S7_GEOSM